MGRSYNQPQLCDFRLDARAASSERPAALEGRAPWSPACRWPGGGRRCWWCARSGGERVAYPGHGSPVIGATKAWLPRFQPLRPLPTRVQHPLPTHEPPSVFTTIPSSTFLGNSAFLFNIQNTIPENGILEVGVLVWQEDSATIWPTSLCWAPGPSCHSPLQLCSRYLQEKGWTVNIRPEPWRE